MKAKITLSLFCLLSIGSLQAQVPSWMPLGMYRYPQSIAAHAAGLGHVNALFAHPKDSMTMYAASFCGGLWVTHSRGAGWVPLTDTVASLLQSNSLVINPRYPDSMFLGTGEGNAVFLTPDAGTHWYKANSGIAGNCVTKLIMDPQDPNHIVAATYSGIYATFNAGASWKKQGTISRYIFDIAMRPTVGGSRTLYAASYDSLFISSDFGNTWKYGSKGLMPDTASGGKQFVGLRIGVSAADSMVVCVLAYDAYKRDFGGLFYSRDGGLNFKGMSYSPAILGYDCSGTARGSQGNYNLAVQMHPDSPSTIWIGSQNIWVSRDSGKTWKISSCWYAGVHEDKHGFLFDPYNHARLYIAHDGGVDMTANSGLTWEVRSNTLSVAEFYHIGQSHDDREFLLGGQQDNGNNMYKDGDFYNMGSGDGYWDYIFNWKGRPYGTGANYFYRTYKNFGNDAIGLSSYPYSGSVAFSPLDSGVAFILNSVDSFIYITKNVYATNSKIVWKKIKGSKMSGSGQALITASPVSVDNAYVIYTAYPAVKVFRITGARTSTPSISLMSSLSSFSNVTSLACNPQWDSVLYVSAYDYAKSRYGVYRSHDFGKTWKVFSTGLPSNIPSADLLMDYSGKDEAMYAYSYLHVFYRDNTLGKWIPYMKGLPMVSQIMDADIYCDSTGKGLLRIATFGRGIWQVPLYSSVLRTPVVDFNALPDDVSCNGMFYVNNRSLNDPTSFKWSISPSTGWVYANGTTDTSRNPHIQITAPGTYTLGLEATNAAGSNFSTRFITWSHIAKADSCVPARKKSGYTGTAVMKLKFGRDTSDLGSLPQYYSYAPEIDISCNLLLHARLGDKIPLALKSDLKFCSLYIDYNNNGKFEASELAVKFPSAPSAWAKQTLSIPLKGVVTDTFIRMRFLTNDTKITGPCMQLFAGVAVDVALLLDTKLPRISIRADSLITYGRKKLIITASEPLKTAMDTGLFKVTGGHLESLRSTAPLQWEAILRPQRPGLLEIMLDSNKVSDLSGNLNKDTAYCVLWHDLAIKKLAFEGQDSLKLDTIGHTVSAWLNDTANPATKISYLISSRAKFRTGFVKLLSGSTVFTPKIYNDSLWLTAYDGSDSLGYALKIIAPACHNKNVWYGFVDTSWHTAANWCSGSLPDSTSDIFIPSWAARQPQILTHGYCHDITLGSGSTLSMNADLSIYGNTAFRGSLSANHQALIFASSKLQMVPSGSFENIRVIHGLKIVKGPVSISDSLFIAKGAQLQTGSDTVCLLPSAIMIENADSLKPSINGYVKTIIDSPGIGALAFSNIGLSLSAHSLAAGTRNAIQLVRVTGDSAYVKYNYKILTPGYKILPAGLTYILNGLPGLAADSVYFSLLPISRKNPDSGVAVFESNFSGASIMNDTFYNFNALHILKNNGNALKGFMLKSSGSIYFSIADFSVLTALETAKDVSADITAWPDQSSNRIVVEVKNVPAGKLQVSLSDMSGKQIASMNCTVLFQNQQFNMPINPDISAGIYLLNANGAFRFRKLIMINGK